MWIVCYEDSGGTIWESDPVCLEDALAEFYFIMAELDLPEENFWVENYLQAQ